MYGAKTTLATASAGATGTTMATGAGVWVVFAAITVLFALSAVVQFVRPARAHRP
ncbi:hypothetical protein WDZ16_02085 [Pseudokineococcus marinus]|uniref:Uncharacterized protein n=1 Tax=Pseudokineococcus marinus TaxID=351215 RepID=A0A849BKZ2_9ACTN|nr:hypothetical protein [Pseudokineococcus marinus]NNH22005.1 hypothetical protein [Pseudokineococcus marinus]